MKASWNNTVIAESDNTVVVEGNHYFPQESLKMAYFNKSNTTTTCPWKGVAKYFSISIQNEKNEDAAWYYDEPKAAAKQIKDRVAFWKGVKISE